MRTDGAWIYLCDECWCNHVVPYKTFKKENPEDYMVHVTCPNERRGHLYDGMSFKRYIGDFWVINSNLVKPDYVYKKEKGIAKLLKNIRR